MIHPFAKSYPAQRHRAWITGSYIWVGIHHIAYDCNNIPFSQRAQGFKDRGFELSQGGSWLGRNHFAFFETEEKTGTCFETIAWDEGWVLPEPEEWYPAEAGKKV